MLSNNTDKQIKRLLTKYSLKKRASISTSTRYYTLPLFDVRFSDHFGSNKEDVCIIKNNTFYTVNIPKLGICTTVESNKIVPYIRSLIILYPELKETFSQLRTCTTKLTNQYALVCNKYSKVAHLEEENVELKERVKFLEGYINKIKVRSQSFIDTIRKKI